MTSMIDKTNPDETNQDNEQDDETQIHVFQMITTMFSKIGSNDLESFKEYLDSNESNVKEYTNSIEYTYNVSPQIYSANTQNIRQVHPDSSFTALGLGSSSSTSSLMSSMMSTDVFYQMPSESSLYENQYDVKAGRWPRKYNECVLVLSNKGNINDFMSYPLGLRDFEELDRMIEQFSKEEDVDIPKNSQSYSYDDILKVRFKLVNAADYYVYDETYDVYKDKTDDQNYMKNLVENGEDIKIVGIVQPKDGATATMLKTGIAYPSTLTKRVINQAKNSEIVQKQLDSPQIDVFTGKEFNNKDNKSLDMNSLITIDEDMLKSAFSFDQSQISMNDLDLSQINIDLSSLPDIDWQNIFSSMKVTITNEQLETVSQTIMQSFEGYKNSHGMTDPTKMNEYLLAYLQSEEAQILIQTQMTQLLQESGLTQQFQNQLQKQIQTSINQYYQLIQKQITEQMSQQLSGFKTQFQNAFHVDTQKFAKAFQLTMDENELSELMMSMMTKQQSSYDNNLKNLGYSDFAKPSEISIYPKDFDSKQEVLNILDQYNEDVEKIDQDKVITYTDYVGTLMSSVTDIVNVISYVLIAFVAISLVVSSIMIGVITYISVLERKKEIGILRAIGASKKNISQVFNAETFIIGLLSGLLGIGISLLLLIPGNMLIHSLAGSVNVSASLPIGGAIILIVLSVILTLIGGLIPSRKAAQEDPVTALRTE